MPLWYPRLLIDVKKPEMSRDILGAGPLDFTGAGDAQR
jgi:hypothetical protein